MDNTYVIVLKNKKKNKNTVDKNLMDRAKKAVMSAKIRNLSPTHRVTSQLDIGSNFALPCIKISSPTRKVSRVMSPRAVKYSKFSNVLETTVIKKFLKKKVRVKSPNDQERVVLPIQKAYHRPKSDNQV